MLRRRLVLAWLLVGVAVPAVAQPQSAALQRQTQRLAALVSDGAGRLSSEVTAYAPVPADGTDGPRTAAVMFAIESWQSTNHALQFIAVFAHEPPPQRLSGGKTQPWRLTAFAQVGDDHTRWYESLSLKDDMITAQGRAWAADDPHCCPSQTVVTRFRLGPFQLNEIKGFQ